MYTEKVVRYIKENNLLKGGEHIVLGVSGGADSICMLYMLLEIRAKYNLKLTVVHVHHRIRGAEADADMEYVKSICNKEEVPCICYHYDVVSLAAKEGLSVEEAGRKVRYKAFEEVMLKYNADCIAVAHNRGDNIETILINLLRGTGLSGVKGIAPCRDRIIRPLLALTRAEIISYLESKKLEYRTDSTNEELDYTRNKIRNVIIPYLDENINDKASYHIEQFGKVASLAQDCLNEIASEKFKTLVAFKAEGMIELKLSEFNACHVALKPLILREAINSLIGKLKDITSTHLADIIKISELKYGNRVDLPYSLLAVNKRDTLLIANSDVYRSLEAAKKEEKISINISDFTHYKLSRGEKTVIVSICPDTFENVDFEEKLYTKWLACDILKDNIKIRTRETGDYIVINSAGNKKKLKDYFIDEKIPKELRDNILLLAKDHEILWVIGYRMSDAFKVSLDSKNIIKVEYTED